MGHGARLQVARGMDLPPLHRRQRRTHRPPTRLQQNRLPTQSPPARRNPPARPGGGSAIPMTEDPAIRFARDTAKHEMTVAHNDGLYRHLKFRNTEHSYLYWFDL